MMNLSPSDSENSFALLHPIVQRWIWQQGWNSLRNVQTLSIPYVLDGGSDILISATTAAGKTEAAWLPIASRLAEEEDEQSAALGIKAIYISPLKALINDQGTRLDSLFASIDLPVYRRHGDISGQERKKLLINPDGVLLITPESLEALFVHHGPKLRNIFNGLRYIIIDELHAFIGRERGAQVQSLCDRIEQIVNRTIPRIALSATLGDISLAADYLRPGEGSRVRRIIPEHDEGSKIQLQVRGYAQESPGAPTPESMISEHLLQTLWNSNNLVFANSRRNVEFYADSLKSISERERLPSRFLAHHGSLSKEHREWVEHSLKSQDTFTTAICTSTLELGIDIGSVSAISQIGSPGMVSSLRQRVGRSGRRGQAPTLRCYVTGTGSSAAKPIEDRIEASLVETVAVIELMVEQWIEPPRLDGLSFSTLIQQILSSIAQFSGRFAQDLYTDLCIQGPFRNVSSSQFVDLLRSLGEKEILIQTGDGLLLPGKVGERIVNHYSFYTAFQTTEEYRLVADGKTLGTLPIASAVAVGDYLIFAGRRWLVTDVDGKSKTIVLATASGGEPPQFDGSAVAVHDQVRRRMLRTLKEDRVPTYLDSKAQDMLVNARANFRSLQLDRRMLLQSGKNVTFIPWCGDATLDTLGLLVRNAGFAISRSRLTLEIREATVPEVISTMQSIAPHPPPPDELASHVPDLLFEKHDWMLPQNLLVDAFISRNLNMPEAIQILSHVIANELDHDQG